MRKRIIALLLALILTVGLLPTVALAAEETANNDVKSGSIGEDGNWTPEAPDQSNMPKGVETVSKTAKPTSNPNEYEVELKVVLKQTSETKTGAAATALVLDCSGSMDWCTECGQDWCRHKTDDTYNVTFDVHNSNSYYVLENGKYVRVSYCDGYHFWGSCDGGAGWYTEGGRKDHTPDKKFTPMTSVDDTNTAHTQFYTRTGGSSDTSRMTAAKNAAKNFLKTYSGFDASAINDDGTLTSSARDLSIKRYVAVIRFSDNIDNNKDRGGRNPDYKYKWYDVSTVVGYNKVLATINNASAGGGTNLDAGLTTASSLMDANLVKNLTSKNVIALTDGAPTYSKTYGTGGSTNKDICDETAKTAETLRVKSKVYTVCFAAESDPLYNGGGTVGNFLKNRIATQPAKGSNENYAYNAKSAEDLIKVFKDITDTIVSGLSTGTVKDSLPDGITATGMSGEMTWKLDEDFERADPVTETKNGVTVTTYTYTKTYTVTIDPDDEKLVTTEDGYAPLNGKTTLTVKNSQGTDVEIPFPIPAGKVTPTKITDQITVTITGATKTETYDGTEKKAEGYTVTINDPRYTTDDFTFSGTNVVRATNASTNQYMMGLKADDFTNNNEKFTNVEFVVNDGWLVINKKELTIEANDNTVDYDGNPHGEYGYVATGLATGDNVTNVTISGSQTNPGTYENLLVPSEAVIKNAKGEDVKDNYIITYTPGTLVINKLTNAITVTITGKQETKEYNGQTQEVVGFTYTVEGAAHDDVTVSLKTGKEAKASGKDVLVGTDGKYDATLTYPMHLTADCFDVSSTKYSNVTIEEVNDGWLKITPIAITLKSSNASKTYDGVALTKNEVTVTSGSFVSGEGLDYKVTGNQTEVGSSKNTYTYTAKDGTTLTNYTITKEEGNLTVTLPDLTPLPNVTVNCVNTEVLAHTAKETSLTNMDHYTVSNEAAKVNGQNAYTRTITLTEAGKDHFISREYVPEYGSHTPATNDNVTEITMTYSEENGVWAWRASHTNFLLNVECTTPTVEVDLGNYIKKTLTGTNFHENFSAEFKVDVAYSCDGNKTAVGSVTLTGAAANTPFNFDKITLKQGFYYIFAVTEREANVSGVICDTTTYEFALNVKTDGNVEFGSVVDKQFVPAGAESDKFLTITNTYTEPKNAQVTNKEVVVRQPEGALKTAVDDFKITSGASGVTVLYPTGNGTTSNTLEVPYGTTAATLLYKITVYAGTKTYYEFDDVGAELVYAEHANVVPENNTFKVTFEDDAEYAYVYVAVTHALDFTTSNSCDVYNTVDGYTAKTTVTKKDPNKLTINFADYVQKELTATGTKTASDVNFTVDVKEFKTVISSIQGDEEVNTYAGEQLLSTTLTAHFDSITGGETKTAPFNGSIVVEHAGTYSFELTEEDGQRTGVTYDDSTYKVYVYVKREGDKLVVGSFNIYKDGWSVAGETITFHNTIDTGKDDYYPIIIPTIINKDTGMLNKTDHFAYVIGYPDGTVHPNGQITRAEVATIFFRLLRDEVRDGAFTTSNSYSDVAYGKWYNNPISTMSALGIITGYPDGTFKPNKPITRAEFAAIAARFDETQSGKSATFSDVIGHWAAKEIGIAYYNDWIKGYPDGTFKPDQNITRAEAMTLINRVLERKPESPADLLTNMNKWTDNMDTSKWYYLDVQEATNSHGYTRKTFNYELWRQMLPDPDWSRYER